MSENQIYVRAELNRYLLAMVGRHDLVERWWESPNKGFDGATPNSIYWQGEEGRRRVAQYIFMCAEGSGS